MTIRDSFLAFAEKNHLPVKEKQENGTSIFSFQISGEKGKYGAYAMCLEEDVYKRQMWNYMKYGKQLTKEDFGYLA